MLGFKVYIERKLATVPSGCESLCMVIMRTDQDTRMKNM